MREGVTYKRLGDLCERLTDGSHNPPKGVTHSGYLMISSQNIGNDCIDLNRGVRYLTKEDFEQEDKRTRISEGDVLLTIVGTVGRAAVVHAEHKNITLQRSVAVLSPKKELINSSFLKYLLQAESYKLIEEAHGVAQKGIYLGQLSNISVPVPSLSTQELIVRELDSISSVISAKKQQVLELDNLAQAIFLDTFGDPISNPKGWEVRELKENVEEMFLGPFGSSLKVSCYVDKEEAYCMVYEQKHAIKGRLDVETHYIDFDKYKELQRFTVKGGDFIMSCRGTIGKLYQLPYDAPLGIIHPSLMKIRIKEDRYSARFFQFLLVRIVANENTNGNSVQMAITAKELGTRCLILPPLSLQQAFAEKVQAIEEQKRLINQSIAEFESLLAQRMEFHFA